METKSLISVICILQALFSNGLNLAIAQQYSQSRCSNNGNFDSDNLIQERDVALSLLYKSFGYQDRVYTGYTGGSGTGVWSYALCPPNVKMEDCRKCVNDAIPIVKKSCPKQKEGATWTILPRFYCIVRYADHSNQGNLAEWAWSWFFATPNQPLTSANVSELQKGLNNLADKLKEMAATGGSVKKYGFGSVSYGPGGSYKLYGSMQCAPNRAQVDCRKCLSEATNQIHQCCSKIRKLSGRAFSVTCVFWYAHDNFLP